MASSGVGPLLVGLGLALVVVGLLTWAGGFAWFGKLPGDIRFEWDSVRIYVPLVSMFILSVVLSVLWYIVRRFL